MKLLDILQGKLVVPQLRARNKWDAIEELVDRLVETHEIRLLDRRDVLEAVVSRERSQSTGLDGQVALPHGHSPVIEDALGVLGISPAGIPFESTDGQDAQLICLLVIPAARSHDHLRIVADVARALGDRRFREQLVAAAVTGSADRVLEAIRAAEVSEFFESRNEERRGA